MSLFIDDGFTIEAAIASKGRLPQLKYRYRPAMPEAIHEYRFAFNAARDGRGRLQAETKLLVDHLVSWDAADAKGVTAPINAEWLDKLHDGIRQKLLDEIIWGLEKTEEAEKN
jgi:hypothetical protein